MVIGLHFFSPANIMRLVEIVRGQSTLPEVTATALALTRKLGKIGVVAGNCPGFIGNRMINVYGREAQFLVEEGASVEQVNQALYDFGMPMGPLAMYDLVGNDVMRDIAEVSGAPKGARRPLVLPLLCAQNRLGQKTGKGWSQYDETRKPKPDPEVAALIEITARAAGIERRVISQEEIVDRCILALVNEGARILEEGMALRASDIDVIYITGYGFPAWRGGPMFYAETLGPATVQERIAEFARLHGAALWPSNTARSQSSPRSPESSR
jgi:3-hydroxyacyl-CoA dehydrogenase